MDKETRSKTLQQKHFENKKMEPEEKDTLFKICVQLEALHEMQMSLNKELASVNERLSNLEKSCNNMDDHISFVDSIYTVVRYPLSMISKRFLPIKDNENKSVPVIKE